MAKLVIGTDKTVGTPAIVKEVEVQPVDSGGKYLITVIDYDGTVLKQDHLDTGDTFTLPPTPTHSNLVFEKWVSPVTITNGAVTVDNSDITIGPIYTTASGLSEFDITVNAITGLSVNLYMDGTKDWGDGTSDTTTSHTYAVAGDYTIKCDGTYFTNPMYNNIFGTNSSTPIYYCTAIRLAGVTQLNEYSFIACKSLKYVTLPNSLTTFPSSSESYLFTSCEALKAVVYPKNFTGGKYNQGNYSLEYVVLSPEQQVVKDSSFASCYTLKSITLSNCTTISSYAFSSCYNIKRLSFPASVSTIESNAFSSCSNILEYDFSKCISVPVLGFDTFKKINSLCKIKVPSALYSEWITSGNWVSLAQYIVAA